MSKKQPPVKADDQREISLGNEGVAVFLDPGRTKAKIYGNSAPTLGSGVYKLYTDNRGEPVFELRPVAHIQRFLNESTTVYEKMKGRLSRFATRGDKCRLMGFRNSYGIILHGRPGTGKTTVVTQSIIYFLEAGGIVFRCGGDSDETFQCIQHFRTLSDTPILLVVDDIDRAWSITNDHVDNDILQFLDGSNSVDNIFVIGTTNHIDRISDVVKRQGRFDEFVPVPGLDDAVRLEYITSVVDRAVSVDLLKDTQRQATIDLAYKHTKRCTFAEVHGTLALLIIDRLSIKQINELRDVKASE